MPSRKKSRSPEELRAQATALQATIADKLHTFTQSDQWRAFLAHMSRFHRYSLNNQILIYAQCPHASQIAGYRAWQRLGRQVRKGEQGIKIFGHATRPVKNEDGETEKLITFYPMVSVFDISQTNPIDPNAPLTPQLTPLLTGEDPQGIGEQLTAFLQRRHWTVTTGPLPPEVRGQTNFTDRTVTIAPGLSPAQRAKTTAHEAAHVLLHEPTSDNTPTTRKLLEVEAESVAYVLLNLLGLDSQSYSIPYILSWTPSSTDTIRWTASRVLTAVHALHDEIVDTDQSEPLCA